MVCYYAVIKFGVVILKGCEEKGEVVEHCKVVGMEYVTGKVNMVQIKQSNHMVPVYLFKSWQT